MIVKSPTLKHIPVPIFSANYSLRMTDTDMCLEASATLHSVDKPFYYLICVLVYITIKYKRVL